MIGALGVNSKGRHLLALFTTADGAAGIQPARVGASAGTFTFDENLL
ncbi:MAG: hypothetical protein ABIN44_09085 [Burkholderiaceae bacterium]